MKTAVILCALLATAASSVAYGQTMAYDDRPKITTTGEAVVNVKPDKIIIRFGIETQDNDIVAAKQKNTTIMKKAVAAIRDCGVPEKDIATDYLSIEPRWDSNRQFLGYFVRNVLVVNLGDVEKVEGLVTSVLQAGANYIHGIDFQTTRLKEYREQARELALKAAKEKAVKMASVLGQLVGPPIQISEYGGPGWGYWSSWSWWGSGRSHDMSQVNAQVDRGDSGDVMNTLALGKLAVRANVSVTFGLKN